MAKSKNSTALFEVMSRREARGAGPASSSGGGGGPGVLARVAGWWRERRRGARPSRGSENQVPETPGGEPLASSSPPRPSARNSLAVDGERREVCLRLSYATALICIFAMVTTVAAAYLAGRRAEVARGPLFAGPGSPDLQKGPPQPGIMQVVDPAVVDPIPPLPTPPAGAEGPADRARPGGQQQQGPVVSKARVAGLNYVIIQGYPEARMAEQAQQVLLQEGIETTVERKLPGWPTPNPWFSVVGVHGFARVNNSPDLEAYKARVREISARHNKPRSFKAFDPIEYKWQK